MHLAISILWSALLPLWRAYAAFRDVVDAAWHVIIDAEEATRQTAPADLSLWHRWRTSWPVRTLEGELETYVWRRKRPDGKWEYRQREMTPEELDDKLQG